MKLEILDDIKLYLLVAIMIALLGITEFGITTSLFVGSGVGLLLFIHNIFYERKRNESQTSKTN